MMHLRASGGRQWLATLLAALLFVFFYETTARDSRETARDGTPVATPSLPRPGARMVFTATAYCRGATTASGVLVRTGIAAADPALLPVGTVVRLDTPNPRYNGIWTVMDTGPAVQGRIVDLYLRNCDEALAFGRRSVHVTVLRLGWSPLNSMPATLDVPLGGREAERQPPPMELLVPVARPSAAPAAERSPLSDPKGR